jgi:hypothetical protein
MLNEFVIVKKFDTGKTYRGNTIIVLKVN